MIKMTEKRLANWENEAKTVTKKARKNQFTGWLMFAVGAFVMGGGIAYIEEAAWQRGTVDQSRFSMDKFRKELKS